MGASSSPPHLLWPPSQLGLPLRLRSGGGDGGGGGACGGSAAPPAPCPPTRPPDAACVTPIFVISILNPNLQASVKKTKYMHKLTLFKWLGAPICALWNNTCSNGT